MKIEGALSGMWIRHIFESGMNETVSYCTAMK